MNFQTKGLLAQASAARLPFPDDFFHAVITSPPYWPHRSYTGAEQVVDWPGMSFDPNPLLNYGVKIGTWSGGFGLEPDPLMFIGHMVLIFRELKRVLRPDGNVWLNYGDAFAGTGLKIAASNLMMMPAQVVLALQADGWMIRNDNVWAKTTTTPEPRVGWRWERHRIKRSSADVDYLDKAVASGFVVDGPGNRPGGNVGLSGHRAEWEECPGCEECEENDGYIFRKGSWRHTRSHEFVFHLTLGMKSWTDHTAVQEPTSEASHGALEAGAGQKQADLGQNQGTSSLGLKTALRNPRTVWHYPTSQFKGEHFATYPEDLIAQPMLSSVPRRACPVCMTGWSPVIERAKHPTRDAEAQRALSVERSGREDGYTQGPSGQVDETYISGYRQSCDCEPADPVPGWVLDPFFGSGTTGMLAKKVGVNFVGVDISHDYLSHIARARSIGGTPPDALKGLPLFDELESR